MVSSGHRSSAALEGGDWAGKGASGVGRGESAHSWV